MRFDVIVIGSGQAGVPLATRLAAKGKKVLVAERGELGGTCVNVGCTPTKTLVATARAAHVARTAARLGVRVKEVQVDLGAAIDRKNAMVQQFREGVARHLQAENVTLVRGHARFAGERKVEVVGQVHEAEVIVVNVGARAVVPRLEGLEGVPWLDNASAMEIRQLPEQLLTLGGGYIGCEFGQMFRRFGSRVSITEAAEHLLSSEDPEVSAMVEEAFRKDGIALELGTNAARVAGRAGDIRLRLENGRELRGSHLLLAVGRRPNTDDLACEKSGVKLDEKGWIVVDEEFQTSARGVYAVGDVTGEPQFTHTSWDDHRLLHDILMGWPHRRRSERHIPYTAFTDPQVAAVGLTEKEARKRGVRFELGTMPFGDIARAQETDEKAGVLRVLIDPETERVLGAAIVGAEAGELIHTFVALMQAGASARAIVDAEFVHPTFSEGVQSVVMRIERFSLR